ncbi:MAG TPA: SRPBCC family protein [Anaerolineae bacterium]|nr:SRPBCC family protein [Anaerolineae bacterium]
MPRITNTVFLIGDAERTFDWITTPKYWLEWYPSVLNVSGAIERPMKLGDKIFERARIGNIVGENEWTVTEWERPRHVELTMPTTRLGDMRIVYDFVPKDGGTTFTRTLDFDTSGFPKQIAEQIEHQLQLDSNIAIERIQAMVEQLNSGSQRGD